MNLTPIITMEYKEINSLIAKCIRERNNPKATGKEFREALIISFPKASQNKIFNKNIITKYTEL